MISKDNIRRKQVDTSCVTQSGTPKCVVHVLEGPASKKYRQQFYYDHTQKYAINVLGRAVSKTYICLPESRNYRHVITTLSWAQVVRGGRLKFHSEVRSVYVDRSCSSSSHVL